MENQKKALKNLKKTAKEFSAQLGAYPGGWDTAPAELKQYVRKQMREATANWPQELVETVFGRHR